MASRLSKSPPTSGETLGASLIPRAHGHGPGPGHEPVTVSNIPSAPRKLTELENQLRDSAQFHTTVFEANTDGVFVIDQQGTIVDVNGSALRLLEFAKDQLIGANISCIMPEPWASHHDEYLQRYLGGASRPLRGPRNVVARRSSGDCFPVEISVCEAAHRGRRLFVGTLRDVSQRFEAEAEKELLLYEAQVHEQRLRAAVGAARLGVWEFDVVNQRLEWDERTREIHGFPAGQFDGSYAEWLERVHPDDRTNLEEHLSASVNRGTDVHEPFRVVLPSGEARHLLLRSACVQDATGMTARLLGAILDVTEQVRNEERLRQALVDAQAASRVKTEFLATMSHEIRTPMNGVLGMANLLIGTHLEPLQREYAETIRSSGENLLSLINDVLDFSKIEAGKLTLQNAPFSMSLTLRDVVNLFKPIAEQKGVELDFVYSSEAYEFVIGDAPRLRQIVLNLVANAVKFTAVGRVRVVYSNVAAAAGTQCCIAVEDTGIGMSEEFLKRVGQAFTQEDASATRRYGGTGLGLAICKNLVQLMDGRLEVSSTRGEGSVFRVLLPLPEAPAASARATQERQIPPPKMRRVLVVEDNVVNQRVIMQLLKPYAEQVDVGNDGREGIDRFLEHEYDCILMDGLMPNVDGLEATRQIREIERAEGRSRTPIIAVTAHALAGDREQFLEAGTDEYLTKPVRKWELVAALNYVRSHVRPW